MDIFGSIPRRVGNWTWLKALIPVKALSLQYDENAGEYLIYGYDAPEVLTCTIWKGAVPSGVISSGYSQAQNDSDKADFEANYKPSANTAASPTKVVLVSTSTGLDRISLVKTVETTISTRVEMVLSDLTHTVASGKSLYLSYFGGAAFAPLPVIFRLKVAGATKMMVLGGDRESNSVTLPIPTLIATSGQQVTVTAEAQVPRGTVWAGFTALEL